ncbi:uncharacterized protein [Palaemon carinicauda]|uniref:uncharacterized protein n=1 Tax=Palaemon carinicauda TaxID=392227 RepID=UPI0035B5EAB0
MRFQNKFTGRLQHLEQRDWKGLKESALDVGEKELGCRFVGGNRKRRTIWWNDEVKGEIKMENKKHRKWMKERNQQTREEYVSSRNQSEEIKRRSRINTWIKLGGELRDDLRKNKIFAVAKSFRKDNKKKQYNLKDENGNIIGTATKQISPGYDNMPIELFKEGGDPAKQILYDLSLSFWLESTVTEDRGKHISVSFYKDKGDSGKSENYRGITLIYHAAKLYENMSKRMSEGETEDKKDGVMIVYSVQGECNEECHQKEVDHKRLGPFSDIPCKLVVLDHLIKMINITIESIVVRDGLGKAELQPFTCASYNLAAPH